MNDINNRTNKALNGMAMAFAIAVASSLLPSETFAITANWAFPRAKTARPSTRPSGLATRCSSMVASASVSTTLSSMAVSACAYAGDPVGDREGPRLWRGKLGVRIDRGPCLVLAADPATRQTAE